MTGPPHQQHTSSGHRSKTRSLVRPRTTAIVLSPKLKCQTPRKQPPHTQPTHRHSAHREKHHLIRRNAHRTQRPGSRHRSSLTRNNNPVLAPNRHPTRRRNRPGRPNHIQLSLNLMNTRRILKDDTTRSPNRLPHRIHHVSRPHTRPLTSRQ